MKISIVTIKFSMLLLASFLLATTSCKKDDDTPARDQFIGTYSVAETCGFGDDAYSITISEDGTDDNAIIIDNLYDWSESLNATVNGNSLTIASQNADGLTFSGSGSISGDVLTLDFTVADDFDNDDCQAVCTKQ